MRTANLFGALLMISLTFASCFSKTSLPKDRNAVSISFNDGLITCSYPDNELTEEIKLEEVGLVAVVTTNQGPAVNDWFLILGHEDKTTGVVLPMDRDETKPILDTVIKFPGFDHLRFIEASGSTSNAYFVVWNKQR